MFTVPKNTAVQKMANIARRSAAAVSATLTGRRGLQLVVCGFPRSGTSLLYNMLAASLGDFKFEPFEVYFMHRVHRLGNIASKAPLDLLHLKYLDELNILNKKTIVLILVRDVRSLLVSRHPMLPGEYFIGWDHSWWPQNRTFSEWKYDAPGIMELHRATLTAVSRSDVLVIRYEDLISNPDEVQSQIGASYGLQFERPFSLFQEVPERHAYRYEGRHQAKDDSLVRESAAVTRQRIDAWRQPEFKERVRSQFNECPELHDVLSTWGYESSVSWLDQLVCATE